MGVSVATVTSGWLVDQGVQDRYRKACQQAAQDEKAFSTFRGHPDIAPIYENVSQARGQAYLDAAKKLGLKKKHLYMAHNIERLGSPVRFMCDGIAISPTTLRYLFIAFDIRERVPFGSPPLRVVEVGGGYGGQASIFQMLWDVESYDIFDVPEALKLQQVYLSTLGASCCLCRPSYTVFPQEEYDLFISNYALDELTDEAIEGYMVLIERSKHGYVIANVPDRLKSFLPKSVERHREPSLATVITW